MRDIMEKDYQKTIQIQQNIQMLERYLQDVEIQSQELEMIHNTIQEFEEEKKEKEILVPIVNGMFFKAKITDNSKFLVNLGADGIVTEMTVKDSKELILKQLTKIKENQILLTNELQSMIEQLNK